MKHQILYACLNTRHHKHLSAVFAQIVNEFFLQIFHQVNRLILLYLLYQNMGGLLLFALSDLLYVRFYF